MDMERMIQEAYDNGYLRGYEKGKADRPKGAWEYNNGDLLGYAPFHKCGVCGSEMYTTKDTFCPNCGARMKGADDE